MKNYSQISAFTSFYKRHSKKLNGNRQMTQNLTVKSQRNTPPPPPPPLLRPSWRAYRCLLLLYQGNKKIKNYEIYVKRA